MKRLFSLLFFTFCILSDINAQQSNKITAVKQRLTGESLHWNDLSGHDIVSDSFAFSYYGSRGSEFNYVANNYIDQIKVRRNQSSDFISLSPQPNNIDSAEYPNISCDDLSYFRGKIPGYILHLAMSENDAFSTTGAHEEVTKTVYDTNGVSAAQKQLIVYNGTRLAAIYGVYDNGIAYDTAYAKYFFYDTGGDAIFDSTVSYYFGSVHPIGTNTYVYNVNHRCIVATTRGYDYHTGAKQGQAQLISNYYPDGKLKTRIEGGISPTSGLFLFSRSDSFGYTSGVPGNTYYRRVELDTLGDRSGYYSEAISYVNAQLQKDTIITCTYNGTQRASYDVQAIKYNSYGNPVLSCSYSVPDIYGSSTYYYYYESYNATGVSESNWKSGELLSIYPNPTTGTLTLNYPNAAPGERIFLSVIDMAGKLAHSEYIQLKGSTHQIDLSKSLVNGEYIITVTGAQKQVLLNEKFSKQ